MKTRNLLLLLTLLLGTINCSKDNPTEPNFTPQEVETDPVKREYGIDNKNLIIESTAQNIDKSQTFVLGTIDKKLWVGGFDEITKEKIFEWTDSEELQRIYQYYDASYFIDKYEIQFPYLYEGNLVFSVTGHEEHPNNKNWIQYIYFIYENKVVKKIIENTFMTALKYEIIPWFEDSLVLFPTKGTASGETKISFYTTKADSLFSHIITDNDVYNRFSFYDFIRDRNSAPGGIQSLVHALADGEPLSYTEYIIDNKFLFERKNIQNNDTIWALEAEFKPESKDRYDNTVLNKVNNSEWRYTLHYTKITGEKYRVIVDIDIEQGIILSEKKIDY